MPLGWESNTKYAVKSAKFEGESKLRMSYIGCGKSQGTPLISV